MLCKWVSFIGVWNSFVQKNVHIRNLLVNVGFRYSTNKPLCPSTTYHIFRSHIQESFRCWYRESESVEFEQSFYFYFLEVTLTQWPFWSGVCKLTVECLVAISCTILNACTLSSLVITMTESVCFPHCRKKQMLWNLIVCWDTSNKLTEGVPCGICKVSF